MNITLNFSHSINISLQVGDSVYYCPNEPLGGFGTVDNEWNNSTGIVYIGKCISIDRDTGVIIVEINPNLNNVEQTRIFGGIDLDSFIMFSKDNKTNLSSLLGYYAETTFINDSPKKAELFAASTEFSQSSK
jgi:hypothetical protein